MNAVLEVPIPNVLSSRKKTPPPARRDWMKTAGWAKNDALYLEAARLGQEYRLGMTLEKEDADS